MHFGDTSLGMGPLQQYPEAWCTLGLSSAGVGFLLAWSVHIEFA